MTNKEWQTRLAGLVVFRPLGQDPVFAALEQLIGLLGQKPEQPAVLSRAVAQMEGELFAHTTDLSAYLSAAVLEAETVCVRRAAQGALPAVLQTALDRELALLQAACGLTLDDLLEEAGEDTRRALEFLPRWETSAVTTGCGICPAYEPGGTQRLRDVCQVPCVYGGKRPAGAGEIPGPPAAGGAARL